MTDRYLHTRTLLTKNIICQNLHLWKLLTLLKEHLKSITRFTLDSIRALSKAHARDPETSVSRSAFYSFHLVESTTRGLFQESRIRHELLCRSFASSQASNNNLTPPTLGFRFSTSLDRVHLDSFRAIVVVKACLSYLYIFTHFEQRSSGFETRV